ncbi:MAG: HINT domain-containing protein [Planctomycetaceae bacterium]|nr:HINT domain-containing protein [Planctomycetaceae bacterium]
MIQNQNHNSDEAVNFELRATSEHPFYVPGKGWVPVKDLRIGDTFLNANGKTTLTLVEKEFEPEPVPVYNINVKEAHTYFVGETKEQSVLVHNWCWDGDWAQTGWEMFRDGVCTIPSSIYYAGVGIGNTGKELCLYVVDVQCVGWDTEVAIAGAVTGNNWNLNYQEMSSVGRNNKPSNPDFVKNALMNAGRSGLAGGTCGASEIAAGVYKFSQDGDAESLCQGMGSVAGTNVVSAIGIKVTGGNLNINPNLTLTEIGVHSAPISGGLLRSMKYKENWASESLENAISEHGGPNSTSWTTSSGKLIVENPQTGIQVVVDPSGNYFRVYNSNCKRNEQ